MLDTQPVVFEKYFTDEEVALMLEILDKVQKPSHAPNISGALGYSTSREADAVSMSNPVLPLTGNPQDDASILKVTEAMMRVKSEMEKFFKMDLSMINCNYTLMLPGSFNPLHADASSLDGVLHHEDEELEYSSLIYLNDYEDDYTGGYLTFPLQNVTLYPKKGMVVFFKGDHFYPHEVKTIESGERKGLVLFYARGGNVSDKAYFSDEASGVPLSQLSEEDRNNYLR